MRLSRLACSGLIAVLLLAAPVFAMDHTLGLGFGLAPDYEGSDDRRIVPMLMLRGNYESGRSFTLRGTRLGVNLLPSRTYSFGPVLNYRFGRDEVDNDRIDAMKEIDDAVEAGFAGGINIANWQLGAELLADISDAHDGMLAKLSAGYRWKAGADLTVVPGMFTTYADGDYMDTYFGVNSDNRGTSGLANYSAGKGFKDVGVNLVVDYAPWQQWGISGILSYSALLSDAKDSPLVDDEGDDRQMFFGLMGTYRWGSR